MRAIREGDAPSEPARIVKRKSYNYFLPVPAILARARQNGRNG